jgi:hypothetical protein
MCNLNVDWPRVWDATYGKFDNILVNKLINNRTDPACPIFMAETEHMNEFEANYHMCTKQGAPETKYITTLGNYHPAITAPHAYNHRRSCWYWLRKDSTKWNMYKRFGSKRKYEQYLKELDMSEKEKQQLRDFLKKIRQKHWFDEGLSKEEKEDLQAVLDAGMEELGDKS